MNFASLPKDKIIDDKIDIKITVKTSKKVLEMTKMGVPINGKVLLTPEVTEQGHQRLQIQMPVNPEDTTTPDAPKVLGDPKKYRS